MTSPASRHHPGHRIQQTESFESFDDVITEVESSVEAAEPEPAEVVLEAEPLDEEPGEEIAAESEPEAPKKKKRKKKISFV